MRKQMRKEITVTKITSGKINTETFSAEEVEVNTVLGNVSQSHALKLTTEKRGNGFTVLKVESDTTIYVADVEDFLKIAKPLEQNDSETTTETDSE